MHSREVRETFLSFFERRDHVRVRSSSLIPRDDPTLLFTNAGMVQFKNVFLGKEIRPYKRATSCQKCMRAGGKHNDLENVGKTHRHHTFFEMLGNFSFGNYFKREAINYAWELITEVYKLPKERIWITIFENDDEAFDIWNREIGIPSERIVRMGEKDNFWSMGDTGPCGPCSEIIFDQGEDMACGPNCDIYCGCDRFLEVWNLVFMQYNRNPDGTLEPLPSPSIDTGMGLERITAILQGKRSNYDTDLFVPIIERICDISGVSYGHSQRTDVAIRAIADHSRATAFLLAEGLMPSNEGRGYVLRRVIRRACRYGRILGIKEPFLHKVALCVVDIMGDIYPELAEARDFISKVAMMEEERFSYTLEHGLKLLDEMIEKAKSSGSDCISGEDLFKLHDTYGFPLDLVLDVAQEEGLLLDMEGYEREMQKQRERARASWVGASHVKITDVYVKLRDRHGPTAFIGYWAYEGKGKVIAIIKDGQEVEEAVTGDRVNIVLDSTPFYGESGGQVGDTGIIEGVDSVLEVVDTEKYNDLVVHACVVKNGKIKLGEDVIGRVDIEKRKNTEAHHTATHLLHKALREVLGVHVRQAGSLVSPERLRFDFTHFKGLSEEEIARVEEIVNSKIWENIEVEKFETDLDTAISMGAVALFDEKYGDRVRVVKVGDFSIELCGGTHVSRTGDIGMFKIINETSVSAGVRRIEALARDALYRYISDRLRVLKDIDSFLKAREGEELEKIEKLVKRVRELEKELEKKKEFSVVDEVDGLVDKAMDVGEFKVTYGVFENLDMGTLRDMVDKVKKRIKSGVVLLLSTGDRGVSMVVGVTQDLTDRFDARGIVEKLAPIIGGGGGGRADMAQAGGRNVERVEDLIKEFLSHMGVKV
ncbi:MAG: alanine--tRNA ligase [Thermosulfidibacteraceae bacterium]